jgi:hypothetical protein
MLTSPAWLVEIRPDGAWAFRTVKLDGPLINGGAEYMPGFSLTFSSADFTASRLTQLRSSMQADLVKQGLYPDEASAMLRTWELSYFKSPGLRFFYIAPNAWVNKVLPLQVTGAPVKITRVMVGRIELISDTQKQALARLAAGPAPDLGSVKNAAMKVLSTTRFSNADQEAYYTGRKPLRDLGIPIPPLVQDYLDLGRFRDVLVLREQRLHPTDALAQFIKENSIGAMAMVNEPSPSGSVAATIDSPPCGRRPR